MSVQWSTNLICSLVYPHLRPGLKVKAQLFMPKIVCGSFQQAGAHFGLHLGSCSEDKHTNLQKSSLLHVLRFVVLALFGLHASVRNCQLSVLFEGKAPN